jgi:Ca-activated chloride channel family protein
MIVISDRCIYSVCWEPILMNVKIIRILIVVAICSAVGFSGEQSPERVTKIRTAVEIVSLPVVVTDKTGKHITDLKQEDFKVYEDGVLQEIAGFGATDEPINVALLLDTSGSTENKLAKIQNSAILFVNQLHPDDEVAVLSFADEVRLQTDFSIDRDNNAYGIKKTRKGGETALYEAVWLSLEEVLKPVWERKALVIFSDGVDTKSRNASMQETLELAKETRATIYCVYYDTEQDQYTRGNRGIFPTTGIPQITLDPFPPSGPFPGSESSKYLAGKTYLSKLTEYSGGIMLDGMSNLDDAFLQIAKELASQYSIGYYSTNQKHDGKFRKIQVKVNRPDLVARTKKGYYTKKDSK